MIKKKTEIKNIEQLKEIPEEVMIKLIQNRQDILNNKFKQNKKIFFFKKKVIVPTLIISAIIFLCIINPNISSAIKNTLGITKDFGVSISEEHNIENWLNLSATNNGHEIKLTKFVSTSKKLAFDYQFEINDPDLELLLEKKMTAQNNVQLIEFGLFSEKTDENLLSDSISYSTFYVEGNTFYGSVLTTFNNKKISKDDKLSLHFYKLTWEDEDEFEKLLQENTSKNNSFQVSNNLSYEGNWIFNVKYMPVTENSIPQINNIKNVNNIVAQSDILQTTVEFSIPNELIELEKDYSVQLLKDGKYYNNLNSVIWDSSNCIFKISFSSSLLDSISQYTIKVLETNNSADEKSTEIGSFYLKN